MKSIATAIALLVLLLCTVPAYPSDKPEHQTGNLIDLQMVQSATGFSKAGEAYCLAVTLGDVGYLHYGPIWAYGYAPSDFIVGDHIELRIKGNSMYLTKPKGGEFKTEIVRRERILPDKKPLTCALPVSAAR
jgi:hypothetical protein